MLDGSRLHTIATECCVVWDAFHGLVQLVDVNRLINSGRMIMMKRAKLRARGVDHSLTKTKLQLFVARLFGKHVESACESHSQPSLSLLESSADGSSESMSAAVRSLAPFHCFSLFDELGCLLRSRRPVSHGTCWSGLQLSQ